ncbi:hypothetical protein Hte_012179 [Hypoxylon texense]
MANSGTPIVVARKAEVGRKTPEWFSNLNKPNLINHAIWTGGVVFAGEERVTLDRANSIIGPISSRTRRMCKVVPNELGLPEPDTSRYTAEGFLKPENNFIVDVDWDDSGDGIKCLIRHESRQDTIRGNIDDSQQWWEPLSSISPWHFRRSLYDRMQYIYYPQRSYFIEAPQKVIDRLAPKPSPRDILRLGLSYGHFNWEAEFDEIDQLGPREQKWRLASFKLACENWKSLARKWEVNLELAYYSIARAKGENVKLSEELPSGGKSLSRWSQGPSPGGKLRAYLRSVASFSHAMASSKPLFTRISPEEARASAEARTEGSD